MYLSCPKDVGFSGVLVPGSAIRTETLNVGVRLSTGDVGRANAGIKGSAVVTKTSSPKVLKYSGGDH